MCNDRGTVSPEWDVFIRTLPPSTQGAKQKRRWKDCKSQRVAGHQGSICNSTRIEQAKPDGVLWLWEENRWKVPFQKRSYLQLTTTYKAKNNFFNWVSLGTQTTLKGQNTVSTCIYITKLKKIKKKNAHAYSTQSLSPWGTCLKIRFRLTTNNT